MPTELIMLTKHTTLIGLVVALLLLAVAAAHYPGGSYWDAHSVGYDWTTNYLCNLFSEQAVNGLANPARPWAIAGMLLLCISFGVFFVRFSRRIPSKSASAVIAYGGVGAMLFAFLVITPYHDLMIGIASFLSLLALFYVFVFIMKSKLLGFKLVTISYLLVLYANNYIYYTQHFLKLLPIMQKISFLIGVIWMLGLEYFTKPDDFKPAA
ncbi:hypothetical protein FAES_1678 [Fibrella aestuarina BUZ 2]|uniref:DUF998 domain-containing protein n=2 Tax=Fibrella TaxID=861914 RepID=I0K6D5_9BACT|nr:hypothetical protein FAES_1678 [Fibrella aestuarina BUZ 2]